MAPFPPNNFSPECIAQPIEVLDNQPDITELLLQLFRHGMTNMNRLNSFAIILTASVLSGQQPPQGNVQTSPGLKSERLALHSQMPHNNFPGISLHQQLADAKVQASSRGVPNWRGLDIVVTDQETLGPSASVATLLLQLYSKQACNADAIVIGSLRSSNFHLSASETSVYGDHLFSVSTLLKDDSDNPIRIGAEIVITRPGGALALTEGPVNMRFRAYPAFQEKATYLLFLRYISATAAYSAIDPFSTLLLDASNSWIITRSTFASIRLPELARGALESNVADWRKACK